jgi:hypothetical protein
LQRFPGETGVPAHARKTDLLDPETSVSRDNANGPKGLSMHRSRLVARTVTLVCVVAAVCAAQSNQPPDLSKAIAQFSDDDDAAARDAGRRQLLAAGEAAMPALQELADKAIDPADEQRCESLLQQIAADNFPKPTLVSMNLHKVPATEAYEALFKQAYCRFKTWPENSWPTEKRVTIDADHAPFWEVFTNLNRQSELELRQVGGSMSLAREMTRRRAGPIFGSVNLAIDEEIFRRGTGSLDFYVEPRIRVLGQPKVEIKSAMSSKGRELDPKSDVQTRLRAGPMRGNVFSVEIDAGRYGTRGIQYLKGKLRFAASVREKSVRFEKIMPEKQVEKIVAGRRFVVLVKQIRNEQWTAIVNAYNTDPPTDGLEQTVAAVVDANGNALQLVGSSSHWTPTQFDFAQTYQQQNPNVGPLVWPARLDLHFPSKSQEIEIPFEIGNKPAEK